MMADNDERQPLRCVLLDIFFLCESSYFRKGSFFYWEIRSTKKLLKVFLTNTYPKVTAQPSFFPPSIVIV